MLDKLDLTKTLGKTEYKEKMAKLEPKLGKLQRECRKFGIPVMIAFEGYGASGKGVQISELIKALDPRGFEVYAVKNETEEEKMHPFMWRFWTKMPAKGRIAIYDSSWYRKVLIDRFDKKTKKEEIADAYRSICSFEEQLSADGMVIIKIFLAIDKKSQKKRFEKLMSSKETAWRVSEGDLKRNKKFEKYQEMNEEMLTRTDTEYAPWNVVEAVDRRFATAKIYAVVTQILTEKVEEARRKADSRRGTDASEAVDIKKDTHFRESILGKADLSLTYSKEEYKERLEVLEKKMEKLHGELYRRRIPVVLGFEGWDAGGKGGAIKRLTEKMDPRGYVVHPTASPNDIEKAHHYLWRFWADMPKAGHVTIFDRTWYGRVMVERIEGFCSKREWQRAFKEINDMEKDLTDAGAVVLKFWMQIDKDEQARRFKARQENPEKQWKITDEDWRNREKWEQYEEAVNEMLIRTSTPNAPWVVVEGNCKYYARIKVLETVVRAIEERLGRQRV
ncbi:MAG: polyphosphate:AMP phosphotransferase [Dorea sp.]|jgi:polyphosphate:AMP phosphotransferase|nr:polyphosphate:AMP phosphotransferase [Dorea sp.]MCI9614813.1 polyphosphate:AMP phosphotransferase [Dorea sp.]